MNNKKKPHSDMAAPPKDPCQTGHELGLGYSLRDLAVLKAGGKVVLQEVLTPEQAQQMLYELQLHQIELEIQNEELQRAQSELNASQARYVDLYDLAPVGYVTLNDAGLILEANLTAATLLGVAREALTNRPLTQFILPDDQDIYYLQKKKLGETGVDEPSVLRMTRSDKTEFWAHLAASSGYDGSGEPLVRLVISDISERKRAEKEAQGLEAQLLQVQKMSALGQLAGGIAHDFNNILAAMIMQLGWLRLQPAVAPAALAQSLGELWESSNRAAGLVRQLLLFGRRQTMQFSRVEANTIVQEMTQIVDRLIGKEVSLLLEQSEDPLWIHGDSGMIAQVVMNLCLNARDAMPKGGNLTVSTAPVFLGDDAVRVHEVKPGRFVCICVSDTGTGIAPEVLPHILEPFFTTKEQGKGTGLGLSTVDGIIAKHGGFLEVATELGKGSSFNVYLPRFEAEACAVKKPHETWSMPGGNERLLIVEDEEPVRRMVVSILRQLGYHVTEAANGIEALQIWKKEKGRFDLLFSDMAMPGGISGLDLALQLRQTSAGLPVIITSGYSEELHNDDESGRLQNVTCLAKPYEVAVLATTIRSCLDKAVVRSELDGAGSLLVPFQV